jgi:HPt (histidine-containing phosphotransfer) domain-containing protein
VILMDMQMPGLSGDALAVRLREVFGGGPRLIGMSGSAVGREAVLRFDGFLLKPFGTSDLERLLVGTVGLQQSGAAQSPVLDEAVHIKLHRSMKPEQVNEMYAFCISDAMRRVEKLEEMAASGDDAGFRREAHTIKGGCAMLGALELRDLAAKMESSGIPRDVSEKNQIRHQFVVASERLERILKARLRKNRA